MGRTKSIPTKRILIDVTRRRNDDGDGDEEDHPSGANAVPASSHRRRLSQETSSFLAGRIVHPDWNVLATEELLAGERGEWVTRRHVVMTTTTPSDDLNENDHAQRNDRNNKRGKTSGRRNDEDHVLVQSSSDEDEEDADDSRAMGSLRQRRKRLCRLRKGGAVKKQRRHAPKGRLVRFASTTDCIEAPEIMIEADEREDQNRWNATLWYQPNAASSSSSCCETNPPENYTPSGNKASIPGPSSVLVLQAFELRQTRLCRPIPIDNEDDATTSPSSGRDGDNDGNDLLAAKGGLIRSNLGIRYLLQYCNQQEQQQSPQDSNYYDSLVDAICHGLVHLSVEPDHQHSFVRVSLSLTSDALSLCCPPFCRQPTTTVPPTHNNINNNHTIRRFGKKRPKPETVLQKALAVLLPNTILEDVVVTAAAKPEDGTRRNTDADVITAKAVYDLVDNVRLHQYVEQQQGPGQPRKETLRHIPGLIPTLRPYQQAAVEWMLQREKTSDGEGQCDGNEWELAWVVLTSSGCNPNRGSLDSSALITIRSLPEWKQLPKKAPNQTDVLYSPFFGWLASSWHKAKVMSIGIIFNEDSTPARGGILADSMGLGKTVEVLACMLANPRPPEDVPALVRKRNNLKETSIRPRRLEFVEDEAESTIVKGTERDEGRKDEDALFTDDGSSDEDDHSGGSTHKEQRKNEPNVPNDEEDCTAATPSTPISKARQAVPVVTPDREDETTVSHTIMSRDGKVEWVPSDFEFGSCVCGRVIPFRTKDSVVVVCGSCREPMHVKCTGFASMEQVLQETTKVVYKRRFVHDTKVCRICHADECPSCFASAIAAGKRKPLKSRATLIVTPSSILNQWEREIQRHTSVVSNQIEGTTVNNDEQDGSTINIGISDNIGTKARPLKVAVYSGVRELCHKGGKSKAKLRTNSNSTDCGFDLIHPARLADYDVVLLTIDALMSDFGHSDENPYAMSSSETLTGKFLRGKKRYRVAPSPLAFVDWWRVCLDEAQKVETTTATCAKMALKLLAQHRWCISGTPIGKGKLDDLYGLLLFLRLQPFSEKPWFDKCFAQSHRGVGERIKHLLNSCFWRSTKGSELVRIQMGVPEQIEKKIILRFSSIEKHFYDRQLEETLAIATDTAGNGIKRKASQLDQLSQHVHKLRAACCHPQVGSSGIGRLKKKRKVAGGQKLNGDGNADAGVGTVILTMDQILDRLIDDARLKCEEAQRLALMHTNGMASLAKLKVEAKQFGCEFKETDASLFLQSCKLYQESLDLTEENGKPGTVVGEAVLSGSQGFRSSHKVIRDGRATLDWQIKEVLDNPESLEEGHREVWSRLDFEGPSKRVIEIRVRSVRNIPNDLVDGDDGMREILFPKDCVFQVASSAVGGEFIEVCHFTLPRYSDDNVDWTVTGGFRTNKSKSWRLVVLNYHNNESSSKPQNTLVRAFYVGIEVELCEADIANDPLQRLHIMHNAIVSSECLLQLSQGDKGLLEKSITWDTPTDIKLRIDKMQKECQKIESLYMDSARALHHECQRRLRVANEAREEQESLLMELSRTARKRTSDLVDCWADEWWSDLLIVCTLHGTEHDQKTLCDLVRAELDSFLHGGFQGVFVGISTNRVKKTFPDFNDSNGILTGLNLRMRDHRTQIPPGGHARCMLEIGSLSPFPTDAEMLENSRCQECKADWNQKGAVCRFCKMGKRLSQLEPDRLLLTVLKSLWIWTRGSKKSSSLLSAKAAARIDERAKKFFDVLEANKKEISAAHRAWRIHLDLMNDLDELNSCKRTMRLAQDGEDLTQYTEDELRSIVMPIDVASTYHDHAAKQAMALGNLRRQKHTLRYLKNQNLERLKENGSKSTEDQTCVVCLSQLEGDTAVLHCGHSFHNSPCFERLVKRHGNHQLISCPLRCNVRTKRDEVMIASDKRQDDGSKSKRAIKGSWGTKVTRLVADVMDAADLGEKSIVFSMWEDMLEVVEQALTMNGVGFVRVKSSARIGESTRQFRGVDCSVLLLNVKNGAEGLTLVEATHVFMIEPLLNCGLDSQAINRIHRIGQTCKTFVHRYLIQDTIEMKIDKMRMERQADQLQLEDAIHEAKKKHDISGGGIDGGFTEAELQDLLH